MCCCFCIGMLCTIAFLPISFTEPSINTPVRTLDYAQSDIIFPDSISEQRQIYVPETSKSPCFDQTTLCEHTDAYPYRLIEIILRNGEHYKYIFGTDDDGDVISDRLDEDEFVCASKSVLKFPKVAMNNKNEWKFIVNAGEQKQGLRVEECQREGFPCKIVPRGLYKTTCKQKYTLRRLLSISYNGTLELDSFLLPSACCCSFKPNIIWNP